MRPDVNPLTVDLTANPDLVVIYYGMVANNLQGVFTTISFRKKIRKAIETTPEGLLRHEFIIYSIFPLHMGMRQYWASFEHADTWARKAKEHLKWWKDFFNDARGTGFWHETYALNGGMEAIYNDVKSEIGLMSIAPVVSAKGKMRMAKNRLRDSHESIKKNQSDKEE